MQIVLTILAAALVGLLIGRWTARRSRSARTQMQPPVVVKSDGGKDLDGQVAIVTGGGTGLGRAMTLSLARRGAKVVIASRNPDHLNETAELVRAAGGDAHVFSLDVRNPEQVQKMVDETVAKWGKIDILINNAAGNFLLPAEKLTTNGWNAVRGIVLDDTFYCSSAVGKVMIKQGKGCILNIVANYAWSGQPGVVHSAAAKAGVLNMTRTLACEWGPHGIRVNAFAPGAMVTTGASTNLKFESEALQKRIADAVPLKRLTSPEEMAEAALFLCSPTAAYVNGDCLTADGGAWLPRGFLDLHQ